MDLFGTPLVVRAVTGAAWLFGRFRANDRDRWIGRTVFSSRLLALTPPGRPPPRRPVRRFTPGQPSSRRVSGRAPPRRPAPAAAGGSWRTRRAGPTSERASEIGRAPPRRPTPASGLRLTRRLGAMSERYGRPPPRRPARAAGGWFAPAGWCPPIRHCPSE
jgi:hypothetical protein